MTNAEPSRGAPEEIAIRLREAEMTIEAIRTGEVDASALWVIRLAQPLW